MKIFMADQSQEAAIGRRDLRFTWTRQIVATAGQRRGVSMLEAPIALVKHGKQKAVAVDRRLGTEQLELRTTDQR